MSLGSAYRVRWKAWASIGFLALLLAVSGITSQAAAPMAVGENGMVVAANPLAAEAGLEMLRRGGNAVDAAVAAAFAIGVVEPHGSGIGGGGVMVIKLADSDEAVVIDYIARASHDATPDMLIWDQPTPAERERRYTTGWSSVLVPGTVAGLALAVERYGTLPLSEVLQPAIRLAREGFPVTATVFEALLDNYDALMADPETARVYLDEGIPYFEGDIMRLPDLADTLERIADEGPDVFYRGEIARKIADASRRGGGIITVYDLETYEPIVRSAIKTTYRGYELYSAPPAASGGLLVLEALNVLEGFDLKAMGAGSAAAIHAVGESLRIGYLDRLRWVADPDYVRVPVEQLLSKVYAARARQRIDLERRAEYDRYDLPDPRQVWAEAYDSSDTTHLGAVDSQGNIVALTQTLTHFFGAKVTVPGTGILMNNSLSGFWYQPGNLNSIEGGKRPRSYMAPTLVLKNGRPYISIGSPGSGRIPTAVVQVLVNLIDHEMDPYEAVDAPRFYAATEPVLEVEGRFDPEVIEALREMGYEVQVREPYDLYFGGVHLIVYDFEQDAWVGVADPRRDGAAAGY